MKTWIKISITALIAGLGIATISYLAQAPTATPITFSLSLEKNGDDDALLSTVILKGTGENFLFPEIELGSDWGCSITSKEKFNFENSIAEVYCYSAGAGSLFQAKETASGDLEVVRYLVTEVPDYENKTYSIEITDPSSVYTFDLLETQHIAQ